MQMSQYDDAENSARQALAIMETACGINSMLVVPPLEALAGVLCISGRPAEGLPYAQRALTLTEHHGLTGKFDHAIALGSGLVDHSQKMMVAARATAEKKTVGQRS